MRFEGSSAITATLGFWRKWPLCLANEARSSAACHVKRLERLGYDVTLTPQKEAA